MARSPHPYVVWRDGRPRFVPSPELRKAGFKGRDLKHADGSWFTKGQAVDWSAGFLKDLAESVPERAKPEAPTGARRPFGAPAQGQPPAGGGMARERNQTYTVAQLFQDWFRSRKFQLPENPAELARLVAARAVYAPRTVRDFRQKARVLETFAFELWWAPADALTTPVVYGLYEELVAARGIATARGAIAVLSIALGWGRRRGRVSFRKNDGANPAHDLDMATPPPRLRVASKAEVAALVAAADRLGRPEAGDMILLGLWTGQRQGDRLALEDKGLVNGRRIFRQSKTGAIVAVPEAPELTRRLAASEKRRRASRAETLLAAGTEAERLEIERRFSRVVLNELVDSRYGKCLWRPFRGQTYTHLFAMIRAEAAKECPSVAGFTDPDLRDTAVTWLANAGCTIPEICAITGHSLQSATRILRHYLALNPELADSGMAKMVNWFENGEEIGL